jgi:3-isopropylmalate dehydrogenase
MATPVSFDIAVLPGDGIGTEVMAATLDVLAALQRRAGGFDLRFSSHSGGAQCYADTGVALPDATMKASERADAILFGAMGLPHIRYPDGTEIAPQLDLRVALELYAGVRPIRAIPGLPGPLASPRAAEIDFVLIRESTEGLFWARGRGERDGELEARDTMRITRAGSERVADFALRLAARRKRSGRPGRCTCVDKANVFGSLAFFRQIFEERAKAFPQVAADAAYVDATALNMVLKPWTFDVMVTENMFGDILSDLGAGLVGGMGLAPSGDVGDRHALFQPSHGSAPDIAGSGRANPTAMLLSAAMMLEWLGERHGNPACVDAARLLDGAVDRVFVDGRVRPFEFGGTSGTADVAAATIALIAEGKTG